MKIQMTAALLDIMKKKPAFEIFISELTERAKIGRVSFYRNYHSKEDILKQELDRLIRQWGRRFEADPSSGPEGLFSIMMETIIDTIRITPDMPNLEAYMKSFWHMGYMDGYRSGKSGEWRKTARS